MNNITFTIGITFFIGAFFGVIVTRLCDNIINNYEL